VFYYIHVFPNSQYFFLYKKLNLDIIAALKVGKGVIKSVNPSSFPLKLPMPGRGFHFPDTFFLGISAVIDSAAPIAFYNT